ncbi:DUF4156 domain-containing protein [Gammaproteobacteria bacterium]|nr:DUF4156 domain-containing protein [Gammaproteobacteria bacterium]
MKQLLMISVLFLSACTWVKLSPAGEAVSVVAEQYVRSCTKTGETTVAVRDKVVLNRSPEKVAEELETLARNRAASRGDTLVVISDVVEGEQTFAIYQCGQ